MDLVRVPGNGVQPETAVDRNGVLHLVYLAGEPASADVFHVRSSDGGRTFTRPVRVNSQDGSAIATGTIRGAQIAVDRGGRAHVIWNGSGSALPKPPVDPKTNRAGMPLLYSRSDAAGSAFEPQRNLITRTTNLDGGGSIAADDRGVYVAWHGNAIGGPQEEAARRVWVARSTDGGAGFGAETAVSDAATGVCGCCALRIFAAPDGAMHLLYRSATGSTHRDIFALVSRDRARTFSGRRVHGWEINACPMTSMSMATGADVLLRAWETDGQVYFDSSEAGSSPASPVAGTGGDASRRKHPRLAVGRDGTTMLIWTEGTAWGRGGSIAWQAFDRSRRPIGERGLRPDLPVWSFGAVVARPDGGFTILY